MLVDMVLIISWAGGRRCGSPTWIPSFWICLSHWAGCSLLLVKIVWAYSAPCIQHRVMLEFLLYSHSFYTEATFLTPYQCVYSGCSGLFILLEVVLICLLLETALLLLSALVWISGILECRFFKGFNTSPSMPPILMSVKLCRWHQNSLAPIWRHLVLYPFWFQCLPRSLCYYLIVFLNNCNNNRIILVNPCRWLFVCLPVNRTIETLVR